MPEKIGFITVRHFDPPDVHDFAALRYKPLQPEADLKLADLRPKVPEWEAISRTADSLPQPKTVTAELLPTMMQYYVHFYKAAVEREILERWYLRQRAQTRIEYIYWRRLDLLAAWIQDVRLQQTYAELGRRQSIFRRVADRAWMQTSVFTFVYERDNSHRVIRSVENHEKQTPGINLEHPQIFAGLIGLKHRKFMQTRAYAEHASTGHRVFSDVSNGIVYRGPAMPRVPFAKSA